MDRKLPPLGAKIATWAVIVLMSCDAVISAGAMVRYVERQDSAAVQESSADAKECRGRRKRREGRKTSRTQGLS